MSAITTLLSSVTILRTGADGGHLYVRGHGVVPGHGECEVYAYFGSRQEELEFERQFKGEALEVTAEAIEYTVGIGGSIREVSSWRLVKVS